MFRFLLAWVTGWWLRQNNERKWNRVAVGRGSERGGGMVSFGQVEFAVPIELKRKCT